MHVCLSACMCVCLSVYRHTYLPTHPHTHPSIHPPNSMEELASLIRRKRSDAIPVISCSVNYNVLHLKHFWCSYKTYIFLILPLGINQSMRPQPLGLPVALSSCFQSAV